MGVQSPIPDVVDRDVLARFDLEAWPLYRKTALTRAWRMAGPFTVETSEGPLKCQDGYLAVDARGYPYPIAADEFELIYAPADELNAAEVINELERYAAADDGLALSIRKRDQGDVPPVSVMGMFGNEETITDDDRKAEIREAIAHGTDPALLPGLEPTVERVWLVVSSERMVAGALHGMGDTVLEALAEAVNVG